MGRPPLRPPEQWSEKLRTLPFVLSLSYTDRLLDKLPIGWTLDSVAADLSSGTRVVRRRDRQNEFRIFGTEIVLRVECRPGTNSGRRITQVLNVDEISTPSHTRRIFLKRVEFNEVWEEVLCDLNVLEELQIERLKLTRAVGWPELKQLRELDDIAHHEYDVLVDLIALLEQRPTTPERVAPGEIVESGTEERQPVVIVECPTAGPAEFQGRRVSLLLPDGQAFNTKVVKVRDRLLHIAEPQGWPDVRSGRVKVAVIPPFGLLRNSSALKRFLSARAEGAWHDLARLLCRPAELAVPPAEPLTEFHYDTDSTPHRLNSEQRAAVSGAVTSPHAFLVQGPPGTGKTEVISETIQQLVAKGERVLLLAPAHVAVDEVLKRVGSKPDIRPLRITFDDDRVDENVRAYLPHKVGVALLDGVLLPKERGRAKRWSKEVMEVERRLVALETAASSEGRLSELRRSADEADRRAVVGREQLAAFRVEAEREVARAERELAAAQRRYDETAATELLLTGAATALRTTWQAAITATTAAAERLSAIARDELDLLSRAEIWRKHEIELGQQNSRIGWARAELLTARRLAADAAAALEDAERDLNRPGVTRLDDRIDPETAAETRRTLEHLRSEAGRLRTARQQCERQLKNAIESRNEVNRRLDGLRPASEQDVQRAESARARRALALQHLLGLLASYSDPRSPQAGRASVGVIGDTAMACDQLATAVLRITTTHDEKPNPVAGNAFGDLLVEFGRRVDELRRAEAAELDARRVLVEAEAQSTTRRGEWQSSIDTTSERLRFWEKESHDASEALHQRQVEATRLEEQLARATAELRTLGVAVHHGQSELERERERRRLEVLKHLPFLNDRWHELVQGKTDEQLADEIRISVLRATNLVCATTKGIAGRGSDVVSDIDFDTLILDEASRVTDSEFLIGAVRARRWVLVGDENQLPPHVDQDDEHFIHASIALHRYEKGLAASLDRAVYQLAEHWREEIELRQFRHQEVLRLAERLENSGVWRTLRPRVDRLHKDLSMRTGTDGDSLRRESDAGRALLRVMDRYLVRSLFDRVVRNSVDGLRQRLKVQRRMPEPLARIVAEPVYGGDFQSPEEPSELIQAGAVPLIVPGTFDHPAVFIDTSRYRDAGEQSAKHGNGFENELERRMLLRACRVYHDELDRTRSQPITVSVLSFYRAQARALDDALDRRSLPLFDIQVVDVIDRIQGQQSDLVLVSFVRARNGGPSSPLFGNWLQDVRRLNVACTRARRALVLVGHVDTLRRLGTKGPNRVPVEPNAEPAVNFYRNLFTLFKGSPGFVMLQKFGERSAE